MAELEAEKAALEQRLASAPEPPKVRLHPNLAGLYRAKVAALEEALSNPDDQHEATDVIRSHIDRITLTPNGQGALDIHLHGDLARILEFCEAAEDRRERADRGARRERPGRGGPGRELSVVAGACNHLCALFVAPGLEVLGRRM